jgi:integrase
LRVRLGRGKDGSYVRVGVTGTSEADVRQKRNELLVRHRQAMTPAPVAGRQPTATFLRAWLSGKRGTVEPKTWVRYRLAVEQHLVPLIGRTALGQLDADDVRRAYAAIGAPPKSLHPRTVRQAHAVLHQALKQAVDDGLLARNVAAAVRPPKVPPSGVRALHPDEVSRFLASSSGDWKCLWVVGLHTGLRLGELLGLARADVAWERPGGGGTVTVARVQAEDEESRPYLRTYPKSKSGVRVIPVGPAVTAALREHRERQGKERVGAQRWEEADDLIFLSRYGTMLLKSNVVRIFKRDAARASVPGPVSPHDLRHTFASSLLAAGRPVPEVAYLLGHAARP